MSDELKEALIATFIAICVVILLGIMTIFFNSSL